jgi:nitroimidazol reductase NimA-like FMN-containing flavoprotein (pyridoxamine 5'-phosphate oxidase superfamily)
MLTRMEPTVTQINLPPGYGTPERALEWSAVRRRLEESERYWLATTRPDGRPHVVPVDGVWVDGTWYFGGHPDTVHQRNLQDNQEIAVHLEDTVKAVIAEGRAERVKPSPELAGRLIAASKKKYGYSMPEEAYTFGVWTLAPRVLAWESIASDPTRFTFNPPDPEESS